MKTEVYKTVPEWNVLHQREVNFLQITNQQVSPGLASRLFRYALSVMSDYGFSDAVSGWVPSVYTIDGETSPSERAYCVRWTNSSGGYLEVVGILTNKGGWPTLNHGVDVGMN